MTDRLWLLAVLFALMLGVFWLRLMDLQLVQGERLAQAVDQSRLVQQIIPPRRGRILDRNGTAMVDNTAVYHVGIVLADMELTGRARRDLPIYRLGEQQLDALVADLAIRLRQPPLAVRDILTNELMNHPAVALRRGKRSRTADLRLVTVSRRALTPVGNEQDSEVAALVGSDLVTEDPRLALERELTLRWGQAMELMTHSELKKACALLDTDFAMNAGQAEAILEPFLPHFTLTLTLEDGTTLQQALRLVDPERRAQAELVLAQQLGENQTLVHDRFVRAVSSVREPPPATAYYFAPAAKAESIAPLLPDKLGLHELPIGDVPGLAERILLVQGDPPDADGLFSHIQRRIGATCNIDPQLIGKLITEHAEKQRVISCEREFKLRHLVFDSEKYDRLCAGLAQQLTANGLPTNRLQVEAGLSSARALADRAWAGQTRLDLIPLIEHVPHAIAVRLAGISSQPPSDLAKRYEETAAILPGIGLLVDLGREYPFPGSASHLIGMIRRGEDPEAPGETNWQGTTGLEKTYDAILRGAPGIIIRSRTPDGPMILREDPPLAGVDVTTEIDMELQTLAEDSLKNWLELAEALGTATDKMKRATSVGKGRAGFALIDCHTGAILALASNPGYHIDDLRTRYKELNEDPAHPLLNYATMPDQPPGSAMKLCTALAGLEYGVLSPGEEIHSNGYMAMVRGQKILRDHAPPGSYDLAHAIQVSSNVYFATIAQRMGGEKLSEIAGHFGLGRINSLDVADQRPGILPRPSILPRIRPKEPKWLPSDDWRLGIGQFLTASPLQIACLGAAVANGGRVVTPYLVKPVSEPTVTDLHIRKSHLDELRRGMERVTANLPGSTAKLLVLEGPAAGIKVAAKTGTAEWGSPASREAGRTPDHAWMVGYAPADNPTVAFACFIHSGTSGGQATSAVIKRVLERYFTHYGRNGHAVREKNNQ
jgi:penicillin-binding protein 2